LDLVFKELGFEVTALDSSLSRSVVALGDIFSVVRANEDATDSKGAKNATWTAPQTFARSTTKYLVKMQHVMNVKLKILEELPVLIIGRPEPGKEVALSLDFLERPDSSYITSLYLEDDLFQSYHSRLAREEGATLLRVRYYGANKHPHANEKVFIEQKTHHKKWTEQLSVKERFCLRGCELPAFLNGQVESGEGKEDRALRTEVLEKVVSSQMSPLVRTVYRRTAFQRSSTNAVRISLDTEVQFLDEKGTKEEPVTLGWAVLEVKLTGEKPKWIEQLLDCDVIQPLDGFSKFLHAVASLHHESGALEHLPHWFEAPMGGTGDDIDTLRNVNPFNIETSTDQGDGSSDDPSLPPNAERSSEPSEHGPLANAPAKNLACRGRDVEPKTYFANERTFIQWLTAAALLLTFSMTALAASGKAMSLGIPIFLVASVLVFYALMIYHRRLKQFKAGGPVNYSDHWGPTVLALLLCITMAGVMIFSMNSSPPMSNIGVLPPVAYVEGRYARGCLPTPLVLNSTYPDSWELQQQFPLADFSSMEQRQAQVLLMDSRIRRFYKSSNITTDWSVTVEHWCLPSLFQDCSKHFLKYTRESHQAVIKVNNVGATTALPKPGLNHSSRSKFELDSHCHHSKLSYNLQINSVPNTMDWASGTDAVNALLAKPFYKRTQPLSLKHTEFRTHYKWLLSDVGGSPAIVILELVYASAADRLFGRAPTEVTLSARLYAKSTQLAINHAEGLIEYLRYAASAGSRFSGIGRTCIVLLAVVLALLGLGIAYRNYAAGHCWEWTKVDTSSRTVDCHLYQNLDNPTIFRSENA
jgi:uncharacterized membrane protein YidH (DUF202 family)